MSKLIAVDTNILVWGIREEATKGQEENIDQAKAFFQQCKKDGLTILVPAIVLGELLSAIEPKHHPLTLNLMREAYHVAPFDAAAAAAFAKLWQQRTGVIRELQGQGATKQELKADCFIVATAMTNKASALYSHDAKLKSFAGNSIPVLEIPRNPIQYEINVTPYNQ